MNTPSNEDWASDPIRYLRRMAHDAGHAIQRAMFLASAIRHELEKDGNDKSAEKLTRLDETLEQMNEMINDMRRQARKFEGIGN